MYVDKKVINTLESMRKTLLFKTAITICLMFCFTIFGMHLKNSEILPYYIAISLIVFIGFLASCHSLNKKFISIFSAKISSPILKKYELITTNDFDKNYVKRQFQSCGIFNFDNFNANIKIHSNNFDMYDILVEKEAKTQRADEKHQAKHEVIFDGMFIIIQNVNMFDLSVLGHSAANSKDKKLHLDNAEFNSNFQSFSNDTIQAFKVLTPSFMQKILHFKNSIQNQISISYTKNTLYIFISKHYLTPSIYKKITPQTINNYEEDIKTTIDFLNLLKNPQMSLV